MKKETEKRKVRFYDIIFSIHLIFFLILLAHLFNMGINILLYFISLILVGLFGMIFGWTMAYYSYKRKETGWLIAIFLVPFAVYFYYFRILRKSILKGELNKKFVEKKIKKRNKKILIYIGLTVSWILSFSLLFISIISIILRDPSFPFLTKIFMFLAGLVIFPPFNNFLRDKIRFRFPIWIKIMLFLIFLTLSGSFIPD